MLWLSLENENDSASSLVRTWQPLNSAGGRRPHCSCFDAGKYTVDVRNYGYLPRTQDVEITSGKKTELSVTLRASGEKVAGPFGDIELKGHPRAAVLLNGDTPAYFVGHVDEFDNNWIWHQWLLVKPGSYQVTVTQKGQTIWSGPVAVQAGQRVIVDLNHNGATKTKNFKPGLTLAPQPRFEAGTASAKVPIAPVTAQLSASQTQTTCGQSATLSWTTTDAADASITNIGNVPASGDRTVTPTQTTAYALIAKGPGGEATQTATIDVDTQPVLTLSLSQPEVHYHKIGDKVVQQDLTTLNWSASNAHPTWSDSSKQWGVNTGRTVFSQLMDFLPALRISEMCKPLPRQ